MADVNVEKSSYGAFERFLYIFFIPAIFTLILSGVLLSLFDYEVMNTVLKVGDKIPIINSVVPDPKPTSVEIKRQPSPASIKKSYEEKVAALNAQLKEKEAEIRSLLAAGQQKDEKIKELDLNVTLLEEKFIKKTQTDEEYEQRIRSLAGIYAKMTPSKSAPILENLTLSELILVLTEMRPEERVKVLEKMNPKIAAQASILLKDVVPAKDRQIAALQERLQLYNQEQSINTSKLNHSELGQTFASMTSKSAAALLLEMMSTDQNRVITILSSMDTPSRSKVLAALSDLSKKDAAQITSRLGE